MFWSLLIAFLCVSSSDQRSTPEDTSYTAAVVEYQVQSNTSINLQNYIELIQNASDQGADIVVFPEMTLTRRESVSVPINGTLKEYPIPALQPEMYHEVLVSISSAARQNQIYVVINVQEVLNCTDDATAEFCPDRQVFLFNTNVVFDRNGAVIDRYRKINLFGEATRTPALTPDLGIFETDFGVTFGHFICFDLMFQVPAVQVVEKRNITDVVFTTMWFSEMPYLTAVQIQQAYAHSMNINFLASGANNVGIGSAGSGIYSGNAGALISIMPGVPTTRLLVSKVPKVPGQVEGTYPGPIYDDPSNHDNLTLITDPSLPSHVTRLLREEAEEDFTLFDKDVLCHFRVKLRKRDGATNYRYRAAAFSGVRSYSGVATGGTRICSIFACTGTTIDTCGKRFSTFEPNTTGIFDELRITATLPEPNVNEELNASEAAYFPISLDTTIMPLKTNDYTFEKIKFFDIVSVIKMDLKNVNAELYTFAVWGRQYTTDGQSAAPPVEHSDDDGSSTDTTVPPTTTEADSAPGAAVTNSFSVTLLVAVIMILLRQ
ncbi:vanin-like protein 1 isoform X2 [Vanessa cardui]|uniref:vanin-like protein 1 isoform X2 n=1 Tax=Vanessa cardui TaxID=171605 RepID=UPI001F12FDA4|nr:vanin-like protein 1 isoform X2 [Vanessa cardui]